MGLVATHVATLQQHNLHHVKQLVTEHKTHVNITKNNSLKHAVSIAHLDVTSNTHDVSSMPASPQPLSQTSLLLSCRTSRVALPHRGLLATCAGWQGFISSRIATVPTFPSFWEKSTPWLMMHSNCCTSDLPNCLPVLTCPAHKKLLVCTGLANDAFLWHLHFVVKVQLQAKVLETAWC